MVVQQGEPMLASDMLDLTFFPIGSILMMDGSWQDGRGGWYICDGRSTPYGNTPDLTDKFIMGGQARGQQGGTNSMTLTTQNLPAHTHSLSNIKSGESLGAYTTSWFQTDYHYRGGGNSNNVSVVTRSGATDSGQGGDTCAQNTFDLEHSHTVSGNTSSAGSNTTFDNRPSYYTVIYIKKMA
jgi:microcystin-dependent protein